MEYAISKSVLLAIVLAPLLGSILAGLFGRGIGRAGSHSVTILGVAASCAMSAYVLWQLVGQGAAPSMRKWPGVRANRVTASPPRRTRIHRANAAAAAAAGGRHPP